jgi:murein tripeptide amidase MpaA
VEVRFDTYYRNEQLAQILKSWAEEYPNLLEVSSLGKSYEGREIPFAILTNKKTGPDKEKPGFWMDGNIHATELATSITAMYFLNKMLTRYGKDPQITRIIDEQVVYLAPRLNPDGAALALAESKPLYLRSGTRNYPVEYKRDGLHMQDIDGDGRILQMRVPDPTGDWKVSEKDPRLMVKRNPDEEGGTYYRIFPEGLIENYDGHTILMAPSLQGLDFNRNFPWSWRPEGEQPGAGDYPASEPEVRAIVEFISKHPNLYGAITYHTFSRVILRPFSTKSDDEMDTEDKWVYEVIGEQGTKLTGYPCVSVFHNFKYHPREVITGTFDDWLFDHKGIFGFTIELWDIAAAAGVEEKSKQKNFIEWLRKHPIEDDNKIFEFIVKHAPEGLVPWYEFNHPQLGKVELGGWDRLFTWRNPPCKLLESEIAPQADFAISFISLAPRIRWRTVEVKPVGHGNYHILAIVENLGFLPTHVSNQAKKMKAVRPVRLELELPNGATLASGRMKQEIGHLEGRSNKQDTSYYGPYAASATDNRGKAEWMIYAPQGGLLKICAISERGGTIHYEVDLK